MPRYKAVALSALAAVFFSDVTAIVVQRPPPPAPITTRRVLLRTMLIGAVPWAANTAADATEEAPSELSELELQERARRKEERRALVRAGRSTSSRQEILDLSRQRAALYNTTSRAANCIPGLPCI